MIVVRRALIALVALAGLALAVAGVWFAVVLGPSGTARFSASATGPLVVGPQVLGNVDVPVTVTATSAAGPVFLGAAPPQDVVDVVGGTRVQEAVTARFPSRTLALRATGAGDLTDPRTLEVWRSTGSGSLDLAVADAPRSVLVVPTTNAPVRVTVALHRSAWFVEAVVAIVVGLIVAVAAAAWLGQRLRHRTPLGRRARRHPLVGTTPQLTTEATPGSGADSTTDSTSQPAADSTPEPAEEVRP